MLLKNNSEYIEGNLLNYSFYFDFIYTIKSK